MNTSTSSITIFDFIYRKMLAEWSRNEVIIVTRRRFYKRIVKMYFHLCIRVNKEARRWRSFVIILYFLLRLLIQLLLLLILNLRETNSYLYNKALRSYAFVCIYVSYIWPNGWTGWTEFFPNFFFSKIRLIVKTAEPNWSNFQLTP